MSDPTFTNPPETPSRGSAGFSGQVGTFLSWLTTFAPQLTTAIDWTRLRVDEVAANTVLSNAAKVVAQEMIALAPTIEGYHANTLAYKNATEAAAALTLGYKDDVASAIVYQNLQAILETKAETAVDVFVYDTSTDSDGGTWRKRTQGTSWYNETLNTATRGSRREFPAVAVIVAEAAKVTIYDGDDPSLPMWMVFERGVSGSTYFILESFSVSSCAAVNGELCYSSPTNALMRLNFIKETAVLHYGGGRFDYSRPFSLRNTLLARLSLSGGAIVSTAVNDVAMTVLPDAPIDAATGLPVPTIAVATAGGVSVIKDDGTVVSKGYFSASTLAVDIIGTKVLVGGVGPDAYFNQWTWDFISGAVREFGGLGVEVPYLFGNNNTGKPKAISASLSAWQSAKKLAHLHEDMATEANSMVAYTTSTYNTGWMNGDIKGAFLSDTDDADLVGSGELVTNGTFDTDISGWDASDPSLVAWDASGALAITTVSTADVSARQTIATVPGRRYRFTASFSQNAGTWFWLSSVKYGNNNLGQWLVGTASGSVILEFTALTETTYLTILNYASGPVTALYDNVSVQLADADRSVNNNGLIVNGTITRTFVDEV